MIAEGDIAPEFTAPTDTGHPLSLRSLRGRVVVLYFYPKDDTPGCTVEACAFRDAFPRFEDAHAVILGVSPDKVAKHAKFKAKYGLPFTLIADTDHAIASAYGVWDEKQLFGRKYWGVVRSTFVIDPTGRVARAFPKVNPVGHAAEVAAAVESARS
ncbi:MAG TPA: thioredoxin-dependent thiol peroxidase [Gemmatimonadaceae bacterium]|nr:thioredoxin-dependent thiol peroxidase [Gemmatimonadaceae bacterium]